MTIRKSHGAGSRGPLVSKIHSDNMNRRFTFLLASGSADLSFQHTEGLRQEDHQTKPTLGNLAT